MGPTKKYNLEFDKVQFNITLKQLYIAREGAGDLGNGALQSNAPGRKPNPLPPTKRVKWHTLQKGEKCLKSLSKRVKRILKQVKITPSENYSKKSESHFKT